MNEGLPRIIQVEFFLTGKNATIDDLVRDFEKRMAEDVEAILEGVPPDLVGSRIKAVARFFDEQGRVTRFVIETERLERSYWAITKKLISASGWKKFLLQIYLLVNLEKRRQLERERLSIAAQELSTAVRGKYPVALETWDHHFRPLKDDEAHELLEAVANAKQVWIFVFEHNSLLSDTNKGVAHAM